MHNQCTQSDPIRSLWDKKVRDNGTKKKKS